MTPIAISACSSAGRPHTRPWIAPQRLAPPVFALGTSSVANRGHFGRLGLIRPRQKLTAQEITTHKSWTQRPEASGLGGAIVIPLIAVSSGWKNPLLDRHRCRLSTDEFRVRQRRLTTKARTVLLSAVAYSQSCRYLDSTPMLECTGNGSTTEGRRGAEPRYGDPISIAWRAICRPSQPPRSPGLLHELLHEWRDATALRSAVGLDSRAPTHSVGSAYF